MMKKLIAYLKKLLNKERVLVKANTPASLEQANLLDKKPRKKRANNKGDK